MVPRLDVNPPELNRFISQVQSQRRGTQGAPYNLLTERSSNVTIQLQAPSDDDISFGERRSSKVPSSPSTIYDRGNSESIRHSEGTAEDALKPSGPVDDNDLSETGTWQVDQGDDDDMASRLRDALVKSSDGKELEFLPLDALKAIVTASAVDRELHRNNLGSAVSAVDICKRREYHDSHHSRDQVTSCQKIFAILVMVDQVSLIADFLAQGWTDANLPFKKHKQKPTQPGGPSVYDLIPQLPQEENGFLPSADYRLRTGREGWTSNIMSLFVGQQWTVCAPFFTRAEDLGERVYLYHLSPHDVLPFVEYEDTTMGFLSHLDRGSALVKHVKIHPAHHNFPVKPGHRGPDFVVKKLLAVGDSRARFNREVEALKRFSYKNERYIIKLLATYEFDGAFWLLFPVADGSLMSFWERHTAWEIPDAARWLAEECHGIATALQKIHRAVPSSSEMMLTTTATTASLTRSSQKRIHGIHGDIKPDNILWFKTLPSHLPPDDHRSRNSSSPSVSASTSPGFLQISDFGTVDFHRDTSKEGQAIPVKYSTYGAPESDLDGGPYGSQKIDVWSLGCVYLEFLTWYLEGYYSLEDFVDARLAEEPPGDIDSIPVDKFFSKTTHWITGQVTTIVKPSVSEWIARLHNHPRCSLFVHDFLDFIEDNMLAPSREDRCECSLVVGTLGKLKADCEQSAEYREKPVARSSMFKSHVTVLKGGLRQVGRFVDSHGLAISALAVCLYGATLLSRRHRRSKES